MSSAIESLEQRAAQTLRGSGVRGGDKSLTVNASARVSYRPLDGPLALTTRMSDVAPQAISWLWQPRIALGKLTIIAGDPGLGKSMLTASLAAHVSTGRAWPDGRASALGSAVLVSGEDDPADTIRPRLDAAETNVTRVYYLRAIADPVDGERSFSLSDVAALKELLARLGDCRLVVIDPISAYLGGTDSHKNADVRALLLPLAAVAAEFGVAIVAVTHLNKGQAVAMYRMTGSLAFVAAARAAYVVVRDKNDAKRRLMLPLKNNLGEDLTGLAYRIETKHGVPFVAWESEAVTVTAEQALAPEVDRKDPAPARADAIEFLCSLLDTECSVDVVKAEAKQAGLSWATVRRAKDVVGVRSRKSAMVGGWVWYIPEGAPFAEGTQSQGGEHLHERIDSRTAWKRHSDSVSSKVLSDERTHSRFDEESIFGEADLP